MLPSLLSYPSPYHLVRVKRQLKARIDVCTGYYYYKGLIQLMAAISNGILTASFRFSIEYQAFPLAVAKILPSLPVVSFSKIFFPLSLYLLLNALVYAHAESSKHDGNKFTGRCSADHVEDIAWARFSTQLAFNLDRSHDMTQY